MEFLQSDFIQLVMERINLLTRDILIRRKVKIPEEGKKLIEKLENYLRTEEEIIKKKKEDKVKKEKGNKEENKKLKESESDKEIIKKIIEEK